MTLFLSLLLACAPTPPPEAGHDHDHEGGHAHAEEGHDHAQGEGHGYEAGAAEGAQADGPIEAPMGAYTARLEPSADGLRLVVVDGEGAPLKAAGEARVMLTGTGEEPQRVTLAADGEAWTGPAKATGAPGYLAIVNVEIGGARESARLTWGEVPEVAPAHEAHDHGEGDHAHGEGDHGHEHGEGGHGHPH